jgi:2-methylcitrate dehydratase PrpD
MKAMMKRIKMQHSGAMDVYLPDIFAAEATITTKNGSVYKKLTEHAKGDVENPMTDEEFKVKFVAFAELCIRDRMLIEKIWDTIMNMENVTISDLTTLLRPCA